MRVGGGEGKRRSEEEGRGGERAKGWKREVRRDEERGEEEEGWRGERKTDKERWR